MINVVFIWKTVQQVWRAVKNVRGGQRFFRSEVQFETSVIVLRTCDGVSRFMRKRWPSAETSNWATSDRFRISPGILKRGTGAAPPKVAFGPRVTDMTLMSR